LLLKQHRIDAAEDLALGTGHAVPTWRLQTLAAGDDDKRVIVVADFALFSADLTLGSVLAGHSRSHLVLRVDAVSDLSRVHGYCPLNDLAQGYANALMEFNGRLGLIAAHCSAATLAMHLAATMTSLGHSPPAVALVAPTWPTLADVRREFVELRHALHAPQDSGSEIRLGDDPARELARLDEVLTADVAAMCNSQGLDADEREIITEQLAARYRAWLGFLLASAQSGPVRPHGDVRILVGRAGSGPLPANLRSTPSLTLHADEGDLLQAGELLSRLHSMLPTET
jgi:hypothetical protein